MEPGLAALTVWHGDRAVALGSMSSDSAVPAMTSVSYDDLVAAATVGLSHRPLHVTGLSGAAAGHAGVLDPGDQAAALLDAAALMVAARRAGVRPATGCRLPRARRRGHRPRAARPRGGPARQARLADPVLLADLLGRGRRASATGPRPRCCRPCSTRP